MILERARCVEFCHIRLEWFKHIEPHRTTSKCMILERARCVEFCHIGLGWFKHIEPHRTTSKRIILEKAKCVEFCPISSGWFKLTRPHGPQQFPQASSMETMRQTCVKLGTQSRTVTNVSCGLSCCAWNQQHWRENSFY